MAIDTQEKRTSYLGIVTPNSAKDEEWRREILGLYPFEESGGEGGGSSGTTSPEKMSMSISIGL